jgi:hypothetical protein
VSANVGELALRALRANRVFWADKKRIRTENTAIDNANRCVVLLSEIDDPRGRPAARASAITLG